MNKTIKEWLETIYKKVVLPTTAQESLLNRSLDDNAWNTLVKELGITKGTLMIKSNIDSTLASIRTKLKLPSTDSAIEPASASSLSSSDATSAIDTSAEAAAKAKEEADRLAKEEAELKANAEAAAKKAQEDAAKAEAARVAKEEAAKAEAAPVAPAAAHTPATDTAPVAPAVETAVETPVAVETVVETAVETVVETAVETVVETAVETAVETPAAQTSSEIKKVLFYKFKENAAGEGNDAFYMPELHPKAEQVDVVLEETPATTKLSARKAAKAVSAGKEAMLDLSSLIRESTNQADHAEKQLKALAEKVNGLKEKSLDLESEIQNAQYEYETTFTKLGLYTVTKKPIETIETIKKKIAELESTINSKKTELESTYKEIAAKEEEIAKKTENSDKNTNAIYKSYHAIYNKYAEGEQETNPGTLKSKVLEMGAGDIKQLMPEMTKPNASEETVAKFREALNQVVKETKAQNTSRGDDLGGKMNALVHEHLEAKKALEAANKEYTAAVTAAESECRERFNEVESNIETTLNKIEGLFNATTPFTHTNGAKQRTETLNTTKVLDTIKEAQAAIKFDNDLEDIVNQSFQEAIAINSKLFFSETLLVSQAMNIAKTLFGSTTTIAIGKYREQIEQTLKKPSEERDAKIDQATKDFDSAIQKFNEVQEKFNVEGSHPLAELTNDGLKQPKSFLDEIKGKKIAEDEPETGVVKTTTAIKADVFANEQNTWFGVEAGEYLELQDKIKSSSEVFEDIKKDAENLHRSVNVLHHNAEETHDNIIKEYAISCNAEQVAADKTAALGEELALWHDF